MLLLTCSAASTRFLAIVCIRPGGSGSHPSLGIVCIRPGGSGSHPSLREVYVFGGGEQSLTCFHHTTPQPTTPSPHPSTHPSPHPSPHPHHTLTLTTPPTPPLPADALAGGGELRAQSELLHQQDYSTTGRGQQTC